MCTSNYCSNLSCDIEIHYTLMLENIKYEYSEANKSRYAIDVTNPIEHTIRCALRVQNFEPEFSVLIVNRRTLACFNSHYQKGTKCACVTPYKCYIAPQVRSVSSKGWLELEETGVKDQCQV